jgi:xanthine dehydrogenase accessory factor
MIRILEDVLARLERKEPLVLAAIVDQSGSAPRGGDALMAVSRGKEITGTIGGGAVEAQAMREAVALLETSEWLRIRSYNLRDIDAASTGMICGGALRVALALVRPEDAPAISAALGALKSGRPCVLVAWADTPETTGPNWRPVLAGRLPEGDGAPPELERFAGDATRGGAPRLLQDAARTWLALPLADGGQAVIVGAGHVGLHAAALASLAGFRTLVLDDRAEFANRERFPQVDQVLVIASFEDCFKDVPAHPESYYVILTRGHAYDRQVLAQALRRPSAYVGMIGSRRKRDATYASLREEGFEQTALDAVHCPIGLNIGAETPEELGLCIAAELVQVRAARRKS